MALIAAFTAFLAMTAGRAQSNVQFDFGDAPDVVASGVPVFRYHTLIANDGARHRIDPKLYLGKTIDAEANGQPNATATGDDAAPAGAADDEDGIKFLDPFIPGKDVRVEITSSQKGFLSAWFDFNADGDWDDAGEFVIQGVAVPGGTVTMSVSVPAGTKTGSTYARFRFSSIKIEKVTGEAPDGEVEDYQIQLTEEPKFDFGDAPEGKESGYPTTLARDGARHTRRPGFQLGKLLDLEPDGQPNSGALGDDLAGNGGDDEDGVRFLNPLAPGGIAQIEVTASEKGRLDAWIDFNGNGSWADAGEKIAINYGLNAGVNLLNVPVPKDARPGLTFARFRLSLKGGLDFRGAGDDGEVEDYAVHIARETPCDLGCSGKEFWLTFPGNYAPNPADPVRPLLSIIGSPGVNVDVSVPGIGYNNNLVMPAAGLLNLILPAAVDLGDLNDQTNNLGIHVVAGGPVGVRGVSKASFTSDGFLALPVEALGTEYIVSGFSNAHVGIPELNGTQFAIVATEPDTMVTIVPSFVTQGHDSGFPFTITLHTGQTYQLRNTNGYPSDLTGTLIKSDKPIGVFGGHQCANVRSADPFFCDHLVEQLLPTSRWGREYFTYPFATRSGYTYRILAAETNTAVSVNGLPPVHLNQGDYLERPVSGVGRRHIQSDKPIMVVQYANSSDADLVVNADPFMVMAPQRSLFTTSHHFSVSPGFSTHYINVIAPSGSSLILDGAPVFPPFATIAASGYSGAQLAVTPGAHTLLSSKPSGVVVYGWDKFESYAYPGCLFLGDTTPPELVCNTNEIKVTLGQTPGSATLPPCKMPVPDLRQTVKGTDNCPQRETGIVQQNPAPGTLVGVGTHLIQLSLSDAQGNTAQCVVPFTVIDPHPGGELTFECPKDITVRCVDESGAAVNYSVTALRGCTPVALVCQPPPGSLFPPGTNKVTCKIVEPGVPPQECTFNVIVDCRPQPVIHVTLASPVADVTKRTLVLDWDADSPVVVEVADSPTGPWKVLENVTPGQAVDVLARSHQYFRLRSP